MTEPFRAAEVFHVMEFVHDELMERGLTLDHLAASETTDRDEWPVKRLAWDFYDARIPGLLLGDDGARALEKAFGIDADFWLRIDAAWQERNAPAQLKVPPLPVTPPEETHRKWLTLS